MFYIYFLYLYFSSNVFIMKNISSVKFLINLFIEKLSGAFHFIMTKLHRGI